MLKRPYLIYTKWICHINWFFFFVSSIVLNSHENASGYYRVSIYFIAKVTCDLLSTRLFPLCFFAVISYFMLGMKELTTLKEQYSLLTYFGSCRLSNWYWEILHFLSHVVPDRFQCFGHCILGQCWGQSGWSWESTYCSVLCVPNGTDGMNKQTKIINGFICCGSVDSCLVVFYWHWTHCQST